MPIPFEVGDVCQITFEGRCAGQQVMSLFHYRNINNPVADFQDFVLNFLNPLIVAADGLYDDFLDAVSESVVNLAIYYQVIYTNRYRYVTVNPADTQGRRAGTPLPPNDSYAIVKQGDLANRHNRGVLHVPGLNAEDVEDGLLKNALLADAQSLANEMTKNIVIGGGAHELEPVLFNTTVPADSVIITNAYVSDTSRVMRRRTVGLGA